MAKSLTLPGIDQSATGIQRVKVPPFLKVNTAKGRFDEGAGVNSLDMTERKIPIYSLAYLIRSKDQKTSRQALFDLMTELNEITTVARLRQGGLPDTDDMSLDLRFRYYPMQDSIGESPTQLSVLQNGKALAAISIYVNGVTVKVGGHEKDVGDTKELGDALKEIISDLAKKKGVDVAFQETGASERLFKD